MLRFGLVAILEKENKKVDCWSAHCYALADGKSFFNAYLSGNVLLKFNPFCISDDGDFLRNLRKCYIWELM